MPRLNHGRGALLAAHFSYLFMVIALVGYAPEAFALVEIGASGNYRRAIIDTDAYDEARSLTGSVSYYLNDASAIELSYTDAQNRRAISEGKPNGHTTSIYQRMAGLDFMYTIGPREAMLRPYIKVGALYILEKRIVDQYRDSGGTLFEPSVVNGKTGAVPSAGIGFRLAITESLQLKVGADAWTSQPTSEKPITIDYAGRMGLSIFF
jgi:outer membrane protein W